ncbi:flagellar hook-length control protein FliK [uncultured Roseobacter sp.]|uniref:flagellar hook-length control protein FliK n=1 Tax=uncultured Roseobacter sp. TaxID=114847 RepID=UPI0026267C71|nr:flagellar hook-length control protein FliK [uncultured Roseobacter sp.]
MTQPAAKVGRNEKTPSNDVASSNSDGDTSDADFDAAYSADAEGEAKSAADDTADKQAPEKEAPKLTGPTAENSDTSELVSVIEDGGDTDIDLVDGDEPLPASKEAAVQPPAAKTRRTDTSELAFVQQLRAEQGATKTKGEPAVDGQKVLKAEGQGTSAVAKERPISLKVDGTVPAPKAAPSTQMPTGQPIPLAHAAEPASATEVAASISKQPLPGAEQTGEPRERRKSSDEARLSLQRDTTQSPSQTAKTPPPAPVTQTQQIAPLTAQSDGPAMDVPLSPIGDVDTPTSWDPRAAAPASLTQTLARPETPGMIGRQMAEILQRFPDRPVELSLNPEELGRVRLSISAAESGITVQVLAERPETLDLMRRHIDQLAREFEALGYESINFAFNEGQSDNASGDQNETSGQHMAITISGDADTETPIPVTMASATGVDIRV